MNRMLRVRPLEVLAFLAVATLANAHGLHSPTADPTEHIELHGLQIFGLVLLLGGVALWAWRRARR
jgi:hypothetical protein